jgi:ABC-2 type transport system permease protein
MNTRSTNVPGFDPPGIRPAVLSSTRPFYWSVRRELWENRFIYIAPLAAAAVFLVGFLISAIQLPGKLRGLSSLDLMRYREVIATPYDIMSGSMMLIGLLVSVFYCLDALYGERRDRSILFWKSLPISDRTTVLAKASIPFVIVPLVTCAIGITTHFIMLLVSSAILLGSGESVAALWSSISFFRMSLLLLYHIFTAHTLWPAPIYCWMLLVSAWARRAPFLWAVLPPVAIAGLEGIAFHTSHFAAALAGRLIGGSVSTSASTGPDIFPTNPMYHITPLEYLGSHGLWFGLVVAAAFLAAAVRVRHYREPL